MKRPRAFTLVELLVVIGIIAVLIGILLPTLGRARAHASTTACASQVRQLMYASTLYANDNRGILPSSSTEAGDGWVWVTSPTPGTRTVSGVLFEYLRSPGIYKCRSDPRESYLYSYAILAPAGSGWEGRPRPLARLRPSSTFAVFVEDADDRGAVLGSFIMDTDQLTWIDPPASWHRVGAFGAMNVAYADGRVETRRWEDARTPSLARSTGGNYPNVAHPGSADLKWFRSVYLPER